MNQSLYLFFMHIFSVEKKLFINMLMIDGYELKMYCWYTNHGGRVQLEYWFLLAEITPAHTSFRLEELLSSELGRACQLKQYLRIEHRTGPDAKKRGRQFCKFMTRLKKFTFIGESLTEISQFKQQPWKKGGRLMFHSILKMNRHCCF